MYSIPSARQNTSLLYMPRRDTKGKRRCPLSESSINCLLIVNLTTYQNTSAPFLSVPRLLSLIPAVYSSPASSLPAASVDKVDAEKV